MRPYYSARGVRIYLGDCLAVMEGLARGRGRRFDLVLTDPPYRFASLGGGGGFAGAGIYSDPRLLSMCDFEPEPFVQRALPLLRVPNLVACCSRDLVSTYGELARSRKLRFDVHVWHKPNAIPFTRGTFKSDVEYIVLVYGKGRPFQQGQPQAAYSKVFTRGTLRSGKKKFHVTQKPLDLLKRYLRTLCPPGGRVLDPFMGSGATLKAALELGLEVVGIEQDEELCRAAADRLRRGVQYP